jgi:acetyl esterase/lipase
MKTLFLALLTLFICLPAQSAESYTSVGVTVSVDLVYAEYAEYRLLLDLYRPADNMALLPAVIIISEGGWPHGSRLVSGPLAATLAKEGFVTLSIDYRGASEAVFPAFIHDAKAAVRWVRANAERYRINPDAVGAMGGSWGGYLSVFTGVTTAIDSLEGDGGNAGYSSRLDAVVGMSTPTWMPGFPENMAPNLGVALSDDPQLWDFASPTTHVAEDSPPLLLIAAKNDSTVPFGQSERLAETYRNAGAPVEFVLLDDGGHAFWKSSPWSAEIVQQAATFLHRYLDNR